MSVVVLHDALPSSEKLVLGGFTVCGIQSTAVTKVVINDMALDDSDYNYNITSKVWTVLSFTLLFIECICNESTRT